MTEQEFNIKFRGPQTIEAFLKAITEHYTDDRVKPGLVMSSLGELGFYAAVVRYHGPKDRDVVCKIIAPTLEEALVKLSVAWEAEP